MFDISLWAAVGFLLAAYAVVGNDALQTLGTFIKSNGRFHWTVLFGFAATVLVVTFTYGWIVNEGDPSFGRLSNTDKYPVFEPEWYHCLPPLTLLLLTRLGVPVSTTFMVLAIFAAMDGLSSMIQKSLIGYGLAFATGLVLYLVLTNTLERYYARTRENQFAKHWVVLQWLSTTWLWSVWLMQDFANIFVFLPRELTAVESFAAIGAVLVLLAITFANRGGPVQKVLDTKTAVTDIRSATIIDFLFAALLYFFKERSKIPMSTTWVFLGLIAGREYAFAMTRTSTTLTAATASAMSDLAKAFIGLVISVDLARGLPWLAKGLDAPGGFALPPATELWPTEPTKWFLLAANLLLIPVAIYLKTKTRASSIVLLVCLAGAAVAFFTFPIY
ncbi:MAG: hypothetical protein AAGA20_10275 [Planctomycetota bacterium]